MSSILDILHSPWAIQPEKLNEIKSIYMTHLRGEKIDWKAISAKIISSRAETQPPPYQVINRIAVINISGVLTKSDSFMSWLYDGSSMQAIAEAYRAAVADAQVTDIVLWIDSPGGTVDGTQELANIIYNGKNGKPVIAYCDGQMTSAAYWIGSAADAIYISGDTVVVGSIGVVATHVDVSAQDAQFGEKYTLITAGKFKAVTTMHAPLSSEGRQTIQDMVDYIYTVMVGDIARYRNVSQEAVLKMADGKLFLGQQAVEIGLVDGVSTYDQLINNISAGEPKIFNIKVKEEKNIMDLKELREKHPSVYQEAHAIGLQEGKSAAEAQTQTRIGEGIIYGAALENERIKSIQALAVPGHETIIDAAIKNPAVHAGDVALQIVATEKKVRAGALADAGGDAAGLTKIQVPGVETDVSTNKDTKPDAFMTAVEAHMTEKKCTRGEAIKAVAAAKPELHKKWLASVNPGKAIS